MKMPRSERGTRLLKSQRFHDAVVGAGILGLAHAYQLARRGRRVVVFERHARACGASVRNFGMLWPIGQPFGELRDLARKSLGIWLEVLAASGLWHDGSGSLHLAYRARRGAGAPGVRPAEACKNGERVDLLDPAQVRRGRRPCVKKGCAGLLWSPEEVCVDPREVVAGLPEWLSCHHAVSFQFDTPIVQVDGARDSSPAANATRRIDLGVLRGRAEDSLPGGARGVRPGPLQASR